MLFNGPGIVISAGPVYTLRHSSTPAGIALTIKTSAFDPIPSAPLGASHLTAILFVVGVPEDPFFAVWHPLGKSCERANQISKTFNHFQPGGDEDFRVAFFFLLHPRDGGIKMTTDERV